MGKIPHVLGLAALGLACLLATGCTTTKSVQAKPLTDTDGLVTPGNALADCDNLTVLAFGVPAGSKATPEMMSAYADDLAKRLGSDFGPLFQSVAAGTGPRGLQRECLLSGQITKYKPGSRIARGMYASLLGLGVASLEGSITVTDTAGKQLLSSPFDKLWAWAGVMGIAKGMDDMQKEVAAAIASTVAQAKGWKPPPPVAP